MRLYVAVLLFLAVAASSAQACGGSAGQDVEDPCTRQVTYTARHGYRSCHGSWFNRKCKKSYTYSIGYRSENYCVNGYIYYKLYCYSSTSPVWTSWSSWGRCAYCGDQTRTRVCPATNCPGNSEESRGCTTGFEICF